MYISQHTVGVLLTIAVILSTLYNFAVLAAVLRLGGAALVMANRIHRKLDALCARS